MYNDIFILCTIHTSVVATGILYLYYCLCQLYVRYLVNRRYIYLMILQRVHNNKPDTRDTSVVILYIQGCGYVWGETPPKTEIRRPKCTQTIVPREVPLCLKRESELSICVHTHTRVTYYTRRGVYFLKSYIHAVRCWATFL